jgi:hypothetical protein
MLLIGDVGLVCGMNGTLGNVIALISRAECEYSAKGNKSEEVLWSGKGTEEGRRLYAEGGRVKPEFEVIPYPKPPIPNGLWKEDMGMGIARLAEEVLCCVRELEDSSSLTRSKSLTALANSSPFIPSNNK